MRLRLDQKGNIVALGWDNINAPVQVADHADLALGAPNKIASQLRNQAQQKSRDDYARELAVKEQKLQHDAEEKTRRKYAAELREYNEGFMVEMNGGINPLMRLAAIQTMAGHHSNPRHPLSGYGLSSDGVPHHDRGMNGMGRSADYTAFGAVRGTGDFKARRLGRTGDFGGLFDDIKSIVADVTETVSDITETVSDVTETAQQVQNVLSPQAPAPKAVVAKAPVVKRAPAAPSAPGTGFFDSILSHKIAGIPAVPLIAGTAVAGLLILKVLKK